MYNGQLSVRHSTFVDNSDMAGGAYAACHLRIEPTLVPAPSQAELYNNTFLMGSTPCGSGVFVNILLPVTWLCDHGEYMTPTPFSLPPSESREGLIRLCHLVLSRSS